MLLFRYDEYKNGKTVKNLSLYFYSVIITKKNFKKINGLSS